MRYRLHPAAQGRPSRFVYREAAKAGIPDFEVVTQGKADIVAGTHEIWKETGYSFGGQSFDALIRGSILPAKDGRWVVATFDPRTCLAGPKKWGYKSQTSLTPMCRVDLIRAQDPVPQVPLVQIRKPREVLAEFQESGSTHIVVDIEGRAGDMHILGVSWDGVAHVMAWDRDPCLELLRAMSRTCHVFHNANYDAAELTGLGLEIPPFEDTIVMAAMFNPELKKGLQPQVLSWVDGATAWKGLVDHRHGFNYCPERSKVAEYRRLWTEIMTRLGRGVPKTPWQWYAFYNGLDVGYTWKLWMQLRQFLAETGQLQRYESLEKPLHPHLVDMGMRGMPVNPAVRRKLAAKCKRIEKAASKRLADVGRQVLEADYEYWQDETERLRVEIKARGEKLTGNKEYQSARGKAVRRRDNLAKGFNFDSTPQRAQLVYDFLALPQVARNGRSTQEEVLEELILRLTRTDEDGTPSPTCKPAFGTIKMAVRLLHALIVAKRYATWRRNFLSSPLVKSSNPNNWPRMQTEYHLHRTVSNRLSSGTASDDDDKKEKKQQLQNVPKHLRAPVEADPGHVLVGGDWSNVEWAVVQVMAMRVPDWLKDKLGIRRDFHEKLLRRLQSRDIDAHRYLASVVYGVSEAEVLPWQRQNCKSYTHGRNFYGSERALAAAAGHTLAQSTRTCKAHFEAFRPDGWWQHTLNFVRDHGYVECANGWRRYFEEEDPKPTEILGTQIQGSAAELCKYVLLDIFRTSPWEVLTSTHDSILMQVPKADEMLAVDWLKKKMEQPIPFLDNEWFPADVGSGLSWAKVG